MHDSDMKDCSVYELYGVEAHWTYGECLRLAKSANYSNSIVSVTPIMSEIKSSHFSNLLYCHYKRSELLCMLLEDIKIH